ncbi:uncharacterized protein LOC100197130 isoform X5 [Hydra vulgaris]|uniref:Uncharacterized protein LOC100197130 isoform X5 n=1 Tax=Hydra vulgaris TaxID=6087 RepID=A0ABM4CNM8_HYDVU
MLLVTFTGLLALISGLFGTPINNLKAIKTDFCDGKNDGNYSIPDVFEYMLCKGGVSSIISCQDNFIFSPVVSLCVNISTQSPNTFCQKRRNDDYTDPWNCHKFFKCYEGYSYLFDCQLSNLVFNPYTDQCVYENEYPCHQVSGLFGTPINNPKVIENDFCDGKRDGNYPIPDVFKYKFCKGGVSNIMSCQDNFVFSPVVSLCVNISTQSPTTFCQERQNGDYNDPWNCHKFFKCFQHLSYLFDCPITNPVFNPYTDQCVYENEYPCHQLSENLKENPCAGKADGNYLIPDVFYYLKCSSQQGGYVSCPTNQIFDPTYSSCRDAGEYNFTSFCTNKPDGQYRNPWNCHSFISCSNGISHNMSCPVSDLVYDPYNNICEYSYQFPCKILNSSCAGKADGKYLIPDVFAYLQCSSQQGGYVNCPDNKIFDPKYSDCKDAKDYNLSNFCTNKPDGQYRNPWNCHTFISCSNGISHNMSCATPELVYDPYDNLCEYPSIFPCRTVNMKNLKENPCAGKADGNYLIPDVFYYLKCSSQQGGYVSCPTNQIFDPTYSSCRDAGEYNFTSFCTNKPDGQYRNPWNCHSFISCSNGISHNMSCPVSDLVYDPYNNICEYSYQFPCKILNSSCAGKADGKYLIPDVFAYLQCSSQQGGYVNCPDNKIFDPKYSDCKDAKDYNLSNFCTNKPDGQYRNPWNCHTFISCSNGISHNMSCATPELVYDPYDNLCEYPSIFPCRTVNMSEHHLETRLYEDILIENVVV